MYRNHILPLFIVLFAGIYTANAQYTETINSNRPGQSQGAFSVGTGVIQAEAGLFLGNESHDLLYTETKNWGTDFALRYGFLMEQLEINVDGTYLSADIHPTAGNVDDYHRSGFPRLNAGVKYLIYDPYKNAKEEINLYSYRANHGFKWKTLIPAVSVYAGASYIYKDNPFVPASQEGFSPRVAAITQNNWGPFVWVNNFIGDQIGTDYPTYGWITTMTHSFNPRIAAFVEFQILKSDLYSDDIFRFGGAYLLTKNLQVDVNALVNFKDTPSRFQAGFGLSYRIDMHNHDEILPDENGIK